MLAVVFGASLLSSAVFAETPKTAADDAKSAWTTDFSAAQKTAADTGKPMFVEFTGSDWCPPCKMLNRRVLSKSAFLDYAADNLVLVKLDFPRNKPQPEAVKKQNRRLAEKFEVSGFPTVILLSPDGDVVDRTTGYRGASVDQYIDRLKSAVAEM